MSQEERWYEYWLAALQLSVGKKKILRKQFQTAEALFYIEETRLILETDLNTKERALLLESRKRWRLREEYESLREKNISLCIESDSWYPKKLKEQKGAPYVLYVKGRLPREDCLSVAVVGARECTAYGEQMALEFSEALSRAGVQIISGMARGVDGAGHRGALNGGGSSFAVLGCGADICYPGEHKGLYADLQKKGGILSEYVPGTAPLPANFPARNRIISGLSDVVLVMEAKRRSGSLITADMALEQGKDVYALPGPVYSELSHGCNQLIRQGAGILISPEDFLAELGFFFQKREADLSEKKGKNKIKLESKENLVYSLCGLFAKNKETILQETGLSAAELTGVLTTLEIQGYIREVSKNYYIRKK